MKAERFQFPVIGSLEHADQEKPVQSLIRPLRDIGCGMIQQPIGQPVIFISNNVLVDEVCDNANWQKYVGPSLNRLRAILGDGLFTATNDEANWLKAHNILMPSFAKSAMIRYHDSMLGTIREFALGWERLGVGNQIQVDVAADANRLTFEIIARAGLGHSFVKLHYPCESTFIESFLRELSYADRHVADVTPERRQLHESDSFGIRQKVFEIVQSRRLAATSESGQDLLDSALHTVDTETGERLSDENIVNQMLTFLIAGSETSANATSLALHYLSAMPDIASKARVEIDERWPERDFPDIRFEDVSKLRYLRRVVDETLRLWPVAPGFFRQARQDTTIGNGKHAFRAGDWVFVHLIAAHRDTSTWGADADEFNPDRFLPENLRKLPPYTYKPFGVGPRACIGRQFALHEILLTLAAVLHQFDLEPRPGYQLSVSEAMTLKPVDLRLRLHRRTGFGA